MRTGYCTIFIKNLYFFIFILYSKQVGVAVIVFEADRCNCSCIQSRLAWLCLKKYMHCCILFISIDIAMFF